MKTTDLIPIILYQLVDGDKYGYEIVKQIEDSSNGGIVIKQPTLYSVLKKLEQGRFISSYWQDSEIGGKRHYYKLTDNGKAQLDTYPPLDTLIKDAMENEGIVVSSAPSSPTLTTEVKNVADTLPNSSIEPVAEITKEEDNSSIHDIEEDDLIKPSPIDLTINMNNADDKVLSSLNISSTDISSNEEMGKIEVANDFSSTNTNISFNIENLDDNVLTSNNIEIEYENTNLAFSQDTNNTPSTLSIFDAIDYDDNISKDEDVKSPPTIEIKTSNIINEIEVPTAENLEGQSEDDNRPAKFTEKVEPIIESEVPNKLYDKLTPNPELIQQVETQTINPDIAPIEQIEEVKFLNYVDFNTDKVTLKRRKAITKHIQKMTLTCVTLLLAFIVSLVVCSKYSFSKLYYVSAIIVCSIIVLYPIVLITSIPKIRFKYCSAPFKYSVSRDFFIKLSLFLSLIILIFAYNLTIATSIQSIFKLSHFANFIAPILFSIVVMLDFVYSTIVYKQYRTKKGLN